MRRTALLLCLCVSLAMTSSALAHPASEPGKVAPRIESVTMNGEIIDPQCYFTHDSRGAAHASCAAMCAKGGQGLSFLDDSTGTVYPLIAKSHGANQNDGLIPHLGKPVQVKGVVYRKAGNAVLLIQSVAAPPAHAK